MTHSQRKTVELTHILYTQTDCNLNFWTIHKQIKKYILYPQENPSKKKRKVIHTSLEQQFLLHPSPHSKSVIPKLFSVVIVQGVGRKRNTKLLREKDQFLHIM